MLMQLHLLWVLIQLQHQPQAIHLHLLHLIQDHLFLTTCGEIVKKKAELMNYFALKNKTAFADAIGINSVNTLDLITTY